MFANQKNAVRNRDFCRLVPFLKVEVKQLEVASCMVLFLYGSVIHCCTEPYRNIVGDDGGLMTLVSAQHDSIKLGKLPLVRHKASEVPILNACLTCVKHTKP